MKHLLILLSFLLIISGCTYKPYIVTSNPRQVIISIGLINGKVDSSGAQEMADKECKKHGRYAIYRPDNRLEGKDFYECIE